MAPSLAERGVTMSFKSDKTRMLRILKACNAPPEVVTDFEAICSFRTAESGETAERLLREVCARHNFIEPWQDGRGEVFFRPFNLGSEHPARRQDRSTTPPEEQSYRRGFDQGAAFVLRELARGRSVTEIKAEAKNISLWRTQPIQRRDAMPGELHSQMLPEKWREI